MVFPGQRTEEALGKIISAAGKAIIRGCAKLADASLSPWMTKRYAKAEAVRLAIETDAKVRAEATINDARRQQELTKADHEAVLQRRMMRLEIELVREQRNLEAIEARALA